MKSFKRKAAMLVAASLVATALPVAGVENVKAETEMGESVNEVEGAENVETDTASEEVSEVYATSETDPIVAANAQEQQQVEHLIINQVYGTGNNTDTPIKNSFIELYNPADDVVTLSGYSIVYGNNESILTFGESDKIKAGSSYLIVCKEKGTDATCSYDLPTADKNWSDLEINNKNSTIILKNNEQEVDQVTAKEKTATAVSKQKSLRRKNYQDTDTNDDWEIVVWEKGKTTVTSDNLANYAPRNSSGDIGTMHATSTPEAPQEPATPVESTYTPVVAANTKVKGFNNGKSSLDMELFARYNSGALCEDGGSLEIVEYNSKNGYAYAVSGLKGKIIAVKINDVENGDTVKDLAGTEYDVKEMVSKNVGFTYGDITSVAISPDGTKLAAAVQHEDYDKEGAVAIFDCGTDGSLTGARFAKTGVQPDMVTFADDNTILTADEGEPREGYGDGVTDPKGSVSIIRIGDSTSAQGDSEQTTSEQTDAAQVSSEQITSSQVYFDSYTADELTQKNIILGKTNDGSVIAPNLDLEPEYIAVSSNGNTAYVSLQEANAIAVLDVKNKCFTGIYSVGYEDFSTVSIDVDKYDKQYAANTYTNLVGARMPDGIALYEKNGQTYIVTANEGDSREWGGKEGDPNYYINESSVKQLTSTTGASISFEKKITVLDSQKNAGLPEGKTVLFGGRGFSVFEVTTDGLTPVYDSGNEFERITAEKLSSYFNCSNDDIDIDSRSPKKGPEPENVVVGTVNGKTYAFIAVERIGGIMVYDITDPKNATYVNYINSREFDAAIQGDVSPEGLCFVEKKSGNPILLAACEVSGTLAAYELKAVGSSTEKPSDGADGNNSQVTPPSSWNGDTSGSTTGGSSSTQNPTKKPEQTTDDKKEDTKKPEQTTDDKKEDTKKPEQTTDQKTETAKPAVSGTVVKDTKTKGKYEVVSTAKGQPKVQYQGTTDKTKKTVSVPNTVKVDGVTYKVTEIGKNTFKNNKTVTKVSVGKNITTIGANAFNGCTKLKTITINTKLLTAKNVSKDAFKGISDQTVIKVPKSKVEAYTKLFQKKGLSKKVKIQGV